jgi:hypothetical protein
MIRNYFKTAMRTMRRNGLATGLNIAGMTVGLAAGILIFLWVDEELGYDRSVPGAERIFRLVGNVKETQTAQVPTAFVAAMKREMPEVKTATNIYYGKKLLTVDAGRFEENRVVCADTNFLSLFGYPLLRGDAAAVLRAPNSVVLTEATAMKYFGSVDRAMGQRVFDESDSLVLQVTGILKNLPTRSHLQFDLLMAEALGNRGLDATQAWRYFDSRTYLQLADGVRSDGGILRRMENRLKAIRDRNIVNTPAVPATWTLQALPDIHLRSHFTNDIDGQGNIQYVRLFALIGVFILAIACINFMNLSTALAGRRAKEVGLRKTAGASRSQLIGQFIGESILLALFSLVLALVLVKLALPAFNGLAGKSIGVDWLDGGFFLKMIGIALATGLLAGCYPAFYLSAFHPVQVLKGAGGITGSRRRNGAKARKGLWRRSGAGARKGSRRRSGAGMVKGPLLRNGLVVVQFAISVILIISTIVVYDQLRYLHNREIGFNKEPVVFPHCRPGCAGRWRGGTAGRVATGSGDRRCQLYLAVA